MICPHCNYKHGWNGDESIEGNKGKFYKSLLPLQRKSWNDEEQKILYACPNCGKTFIAV